MPLLKGAFKLTDRGVHPRTQSRKGAGFRRGRIVMTPALIGRKVGMTRIYDDKGAIVPVTVVEAGPCAVTQVKTTETDGYNAVQLGFKDIKAKSSTFGLIGHAAKAGVGPKKYFKEIKLKDATDKKAGDTVTADIFNDVKYVDVIGVSKGKGTAGVMKIGRAHV